MAPLSPADLVKTIAYGMYMGVWEGVIHLTAMPYCAARSSDIKFVISVHTVLRRCFSIADLSSVLK